MTPNDQLTSNSYNPTDNASISLPPTKAKATKGSKAPAPKVKAGTLKQFKVSTSKPLSVKVPSSGGGLRGLATAKRLMAGAISNSKTASKLMAG